VGARVTRHPREVVAGLLSLAFGAVLVQYARGLPEMPGGYPGPGLFPTIVGVLFALFGTVLIVQAVVGRVAAVEESGDPSVSRWQAVANIAVIVAAVPLYVLLSEWLGFTVTMILLMLGVMLWLRARLLVAVPAAVVVALAVAYLFGNVLRVPLPQGPFG
jgi:putative tricarboxylic transport membrane protein